MWNNAFNEDDLENPKLADEYGVVMGTSHQEPMLRAQQEWDRGLGKEYGKWNYNNTNQQPVLERLSHLHDQLHTAAKLVLLRAPEDEALM